jgi:hypothetical protein
MTEFDRQFNKSFDDLYFLENYSNNKDRFIFVFDFDLTLTNKSSDGLGFNSNYIDLFDSELKLSRLKDLFGKIIELNYRIYINTRGLISDVKHILSCVGFTIGNNKMIQEIKGSKDISNVKQPFSNLDLEFYKLEQIDDINILWSIKKVLFLNEITEVEKVPKLNILFFDDSKLNINIAKLNSYSNSFLIGSNDSGIYGLDYLLIKLNQILDIL